MEKLRVLEGFSGYGSQSMSLRDMGISHEVVGISEIEPDAIIAYGSIRFDLKDLRTDKTHDEMKKELMDKNVGWDFQKNKSRIPRMKKDKLEMLYKFDKASNNFGDITMINPSDLPDFDYFTMSFPCTDLSVAGKQEGLVRGKTRSGLLYECEKVIENKKPKYILMENVKNLVGEKFIIQFNEWLEYLESLGYKNYWKVLNAKNYGIAQNRERVFCVSILCDEKYEFPNGFKLDKRLKDFLEESVEEKYYLKNTKDFFIKNSFDMESKGNGFRFKHHVKNNADISNTITTRAGSRMDDNFIIDIESNQDKFEFSTNNNELKGIRLGGVFDTDKSRHQAGSVWDKEPLCPTLDTMQGGWRQPCVLDYIKQLRIRKLTPKECLRLMGVSDLDINKMSSVRLSDSSLYKLAGNSIVKQCLDAIHTNLFKTEL